MSQGSHQEIARTLATDVAMAVARRRSADKRRKPTTVDEYLATLPADQRAALRRVRRIIRARIS